MEIFKKNKFNIRHNILKSLYAIHEVDFQAELKKAQKDNPDIKHLLEQLMNLCSLSISIISMKENKDHVQYLIGSEYMEYNKQLTRFELTDKGLIAFLDESLIETKWDRFWNRSATKISVFAGMLGIIIAGISQYNSLIHNHENDKELLRLKNKIDLIQESNKMESQLLRGKLNASDTVHVRILRDSLSTE